MTDRAWPFDVPPDSTAQTTQRVLDGAPILFVTHDAADGTWQFHDSGQVAKDEVRVCTLGNVVALDPSLLAIADTPPDWLAYRDHLDAPWHKRPT